ncbi:MAG TPA: ABC transporter ATP-binding protein [Casimicrobiaceae bacterium]|jgi:iron(III) transport system ATP-binding protein|nr:ABC transporter ATP-binding protein [Casimicrobiaceae bacterium]
MPHLELCGLTKRYGALTSVDAIDLAVERGEFICLLGPSGCGKTTTLRMLAGFLAPDAGEIRVAGNVMSSPEAVIQPERRNMGMIFQSYAVWPHMTVRENVGYGLKMKSMPAAQRQARTDVLLSATRLADLADRYPAELSGGQQQRVALARALAPNPGILLLDEPLSNLDANLRGEMRFEIRRLHEEYRNTSIYVTHDQVEAMTMADRIVVMNGGRIEQIGTPEDVYDRPGSRFVARFIGATNVIDGTHVHGNRVEVSGHVLEVEQGEFAGPGKPMSVCVKTHDVDLLADERTDGTNVLPGIVRSQAYLGSHRDYIVDVGQELLIAAPASVNIPAGSRVKIHFRAERCRGIIR